MWVWFLRKASFSPDAAQVQQFGLPADANLGDITIHAGVNILGVSFQCADAFRGKSEPTNQIDVILDINTDDPASAQAAEDFYQRVSASGTVTVGLETIFLKRNCDVVK